MQMGSLGDSGDTIQKTQQNHNVGTNTVLGAIRMASARTGVDFAYLLNKADQESGMNPAAKASSSSATGLFQFISQTWLKMVKDHGSDYGLDKEADAISQKNGKMQVSDPAVKEKILNLRHDPVLNAAMAAEYTRENKDYLDAKLGGGVGSTELYLAHFLGAGGAEKFIKAMRASPNAPAAEIMPEAAAANTPVFYNKSGAARSLQQIYNHFAAKFQKQDTSHFGMALAATAPPAFTAPGAPVIQRDLAELSSYFYHAPVEAPVASSMPMISNDWQRNIATSDTLFNAMVLAQSKMNQALSKQAS
ncbi:MAG TPA: transglycosylase SLT domain-containing protein [Alphaproteobacteria bacterium]|nr:transglycosylase SLT domain-containing protein [Alphaproteobacteria bacterium]